MGKKNNIIHINGKRYDAITGKSLDGHAAATAKPASRNVDGVLSKSSPSPPIKIAVKPATKSKPAARPATATPAARRAHQPQPSRTLVRQAVKKPAASAKRHRTAQGHLVSLTPHVQSSLQIKQSAQRLDSKRLQHARRIAKSRAISRFGPDQPSATSSPILTSPTTPALPVVSAPTNPSKPAAKPHPPTTTDLLERAVERATSHLEPAPKGRRPKSRRSKQITGISSIVLAMTILLGVVSLQHLTSLRLHMASSKAGFVASVPSSQPAGYHLTNLKYEPGIVALNFQNHYHDQYAITEKTSMWDSSTLRESFVAVDNQQYQVVQTAGRTIYIYGQNNATWVNAGVWYQIQTNGVLSNNQLLALASST